MQYQVTAAETHQAKVPHHIFNLNIILTHLFVSYTVFEIAHGQNWPFLIILLVSLTVLGYIHMRAKRAKSQLESGGSWFVAAHWTLAWHRSRILILSYFIALAIVALYALSNILFPGGLSMNSFDDVGSSRNIGEIIAVRFAATVIFVAVLITFMQTGISVYDAGKGIIDAKMEKFVPRNANANKELGMSEDEGALPPTASLVSKSPDEAPEPLSTTESKR